MKEFKTERVQKLIANAGVCSRREAEKLIQDGKVRVNGKTIELGSKAHPSDAIFVNNKPLQFSQERPTTLVLNKPPRPNPREAPVTIQTLYILCSRLLAISATLAF